MRYRVSIEGVEREVDVQLGPGGSVTVSLDGEPVDADVRRIPGGVSLTLGGQVWDVLVGGPADAMQLACGEHRVTAAVESERARARRKTTASADAAKELRSPMPGRVVKVLVTAGEEVTADQPLVVIEAMKMENELRAVAAAKVVSVEVREGQNVEGNVVLLRFE